MKQTDVCFKSLRLRRDVIPLERRFVVVLPSKYTEKMPDCASIFDTYRKIIEVEQPIKSVAIDQAISQSVRSPDEFISSSDFEDR